MDMRLTCNFTMIVAGPSGSGKSDFVSKLLRSRQDIMANVRNRIVYCYSVWQPSYVALQNLIPTIEFTNGLPGEEVIEDGNLILVVDDLMDSDAAAGLMSDIFTKFSHHRNITCIFILQNLFPKFKQARTISLNAHYIVLMKNNRDKAQVRHLASQSFPGNAKYLIDSYEDATLSPYSYLLLDFKPETTDSVRVRTQIFPGEDMCAYVKV